MTLSNGDQRGPPAPPEGVDAICDVFEAAWLAGQEPRIEDFLPGGEPVHQDVLLRELLLAEWDLRRRHEQHVELQTYLQRFAESGQFVAELWHVWQAKQSEGSLDGRANGLATALHSPPAEELGTVIGRYKLLEKLGEGGFGTVWVAEQREPVKRRVALKVIKLGMDTRQVIARFEAERQALALMDHPNIAKVLDAGATETGGPYFVMELVRGIPITKYCEQERLVDTGSPGPLHEGLPCDPARAPEGDHPPRHQALEHPGDAARRRAGAEGDRLRDRQGDPAGANGEDDLHAACNSSSARPPT